MKYRIKIINDGECEIYNEIIEAENENKALEKVLKEETIYAGDRIEIEFE
jgi:hypothetical protein